MDSRPIRDSLSSDFSTCVEQLGLKSFLDAAEDSETSSTYTPFVPHPLSVISEKIEWNEREQKSAFEDWENDQKSGAKKRKERPIQSNATTNDLQTFESHVYHLNVPILECSA